MPTNPSVVSLFSAPVYTVEAPEFLEVTKRVANKFVEKRKEQANLNENFPVYMTENMHDDPELSAFATFIAQFAWDVLNSQGYQMEFFKTYFKEMWCQEHHKGSFMDKHIHGNNAVISGFYFLNCPSGSKALFHDPRDAKVITNLPEKDDLKPTHASNIITLDANDGLLMLSNSWLPHSFNRIAGDVPLSFIHFNIAVLPLPREITTPEII